MNEGGKKFVSFSFQTIKIWISEQSMRKGPKKKKE